MLIDACCYASKGTMLTPSMISCSKIFFKSGCICLSLGGMH